MFIGCTLSPEDSGSGHEAVCNPMVFLEAGGLEDIIKGQAKILSLLLRNRRNEVCQVDKCCGSPQDPQDEGAPGQSQGRVIGEPFTGVSVGTLCRVEW